MIPRVAYQADTLTRSMHIAIHDLKVERLLVVYPGRQGYSLTEKIEALPIGQLPERVKGLQ